MRSFTIVAAALLCSLTSSVSLSASQETDVAGTASISGRMVSIDGLAGTEPILVVPASVKIPIALEAYAPDGDPDLILQAGSARTGPGFVIADSAGNYRVSGLAPGEYLVLATTLLLFETPPPEAVEVSLRGVAFTARGYRLSLTAGQSAEGFDFVFPKAIREPRGPSLPETLAIISTTSSVQARFVEDQNADGLASATDPGASAVTLLDLVVVPPGESAVPVSEFNTPPLVSLFTARDGTFGFSEIPAGTYQLWIWWSPGFVDLPTAPTNPGLVIAGLTVHADGRVTSALPADILVKPATAGMVGFPVRSGEGPRPIAGGVVNVRESLAGRVTLPSTGGGAPWRNETLIPLLGAALLAVSLVGGVALSLRRRRA